MTDAFVEQVGAEECSCPMTNDEHRAKAAELINQDRAIHAEFVHPTVDDVYDVRQAQGIFPLASLATMRIALHHEVDRYLSKFDDVGPEGMTDGELRWLCMIMATEHGLNVAGDSLTAHDLLMHGGLTDEMGGDLD